jgi:C1A family cysteine protease
MRSAIFTNQNCNRGSFASRPFLKTAWHMRSLRLSAICLLAVFATAMTAHGQQMPDAQESASGQESVDSGQAVPVLGQLRMAPPNPEYVKFMDALGRGMVPARVTADGHGLGYIPSPIDLSHLRNQKVAFPMVTTTLPATYDLRTTGRVTPVRDQGACGDCWAFATMASAESALEPKEARDFSENNLKDLNGFGSSPCAGGNYMMAAAYMARWAGPVNESDDPYLATDTNTSPANAPVQKHVQNILIFAGRTGPLDNDILKNAIMTYGGLAATMYADVSAASANYKSSTAAYYYSGTQTANHGVTLVGWDDNFSKSNFAKAPAGNGAFLIKNSWGTSFGQSGYFWISYYDTVFASGSSTSFEGEESAGNYTNQYSYDPLGWTSETGYGSSTAYSATVFTSGSNEVLGAVATYFASNNSTYTIQVYTGVTSGPTSGTLAWTGSGTVAIAGYHTLPLSPVTLTNGQKFSVVVKLTTPGNTYPVPLSSATSSAGQNYISFNGQTWSNLSKTVALNAFTTRVTGAIANLSSTSLVFPATTVGSSSAAQKVTVTNTGTSALTFSKIAVTGTGATSFSMQSACGSSLAANASCSVSVSFVPLSAASLSASLTLTDNSQTSTTKTQSVTLSGSAISAQVLFAPAPGTYTAAKTVTMTSTAPTDTIYYTVDGTSPTTSSTKYSGALTVSKTTTFRAMATAPGFPISPLTTATYTINLPPVAAIPTFKPAAGTYGAAQWVTVASSTPNATIYYLTDGSVPSVKYKGPIAVTLTGTTVKALAGASGYTNSAVSTSAYTLIASPQVYTGLVSAIGTTTATLTAFVTSPAEAPQVQFSWGTKSDSLSKSTSWTSLPAKTSVQTVSTVLTGLTSKTTYYFSPLAFNSGGWGYGIVQSFTTK